MSEKTVDSKFRFFQKMVAAPYLLALIGLLLPLVNVSCASQVIAEPNFYEIASGLDLEKTFKEPALGHLKKMQQANPKALEKFKEQIPDFPKMTPVIHLYAIVGALILGAVFAWLAQYGFFASIGSILMGILSMVSLWAFLAQMSQYVSAIGMNVIAIEPGVGIYCACALILIGTAMNLASIIRPIINERKSNKEKKCLFAQK